ncbi:hypothetical protein E2C01_026332 [Portunus trituberculatus]|uniref:Uncharacterized protein n=1 Tax=Portunus trituberculatus TaxID=210409 RepID=A0A5B7EKN0_PORTR|nr:hypothetical protein [Portunus trituberculatus]
MAGSRDCQTGYHSLVSSGLENLRVWADSKAQEKKEKEDLEEDLMRMAGLTVEGCQVVVRESPPPQGLMGGGLCGGDGMVYCVVTLHGWWSVWCGVV